MTNVYAAGQIGSVGGQNPAAGTRHRVAAVMSHPVQYHAPLFSKLANHPMAELTVYYGHHGLPVDRDFSVPVKWDRHLLDGYKFSVLASGAARLSTLKRFFACLKIIPALWHGEYDAVIIHSYATALSLLAYVGAYVSRTPVVLRSESELLRPRGLWLRWVKRVFLKIIFRHTAAFIWMGNTNRAFLRHYGAEEKKLYYAPYCVDNDFFRTAVPKVQWRGRDTKRSLGLDPDKPVIVFSGKLIERKRPLDVAEAYARLTERGIEASLIFIGDGVLRTQIEAFCARRHLRNVRIVGFKNQTELPEWYACGSALVLPSEIDTWGLVVNEGMLFGMPAIVTDMVGAGYDLVEPGKTGYVYPVGDIDRLTEHLSALLFRPEVCAGMGACAEAKIANFSYEACLEGIVRAVDSVSRSGKRASS